MYKRFIKLLSLFLCIALLVQMVPAGALAAELSASDSVSADTSVEDAYVLEELVEERTEYGKVFRLSNGLHMAAVYNEAVHYADGGQWKDIDNTLISDNGRYKNTAGVWEVSFPQNMTGSAPVTIEKDGYTLSFALAGQLRGGNGAVVASAELGAEEFQLEDTRASQGQIQTMDLTKEKAEAQHPETVRDKLHARLRYSNVYANTNVIYDLASNRVKESIVIGGFDAQLRGYRYTLNTGDMVPVLTDSGEILLYDRKGQTVIMTMPAPYLVDDAGVYNYAVQVSLTGANGSYTLTYTLPQAWLAEEERTYPVILDPVIAAGGS